MDILKRFIAGLLIVPFMTIAVMPSARASQMPLMPKPDMMVAPTAPFTPALVRGITVDLLHPFQFNFIVGVGDDDLQGDVFKKEAMKLIKYFLVALTVPENDVWVNLSPFEKDRIIPEHFGKTEMGKELLLQDYMLKQLTAGLTNPQQKLGQQFWQRVREKVKQKWGTMDVPTDMFNKVWIVPDKARVYVKGQSVYVVDSHLKVMLEEDYVARGNAVIQGQLNLTQENKEAGEIVKQAIRDIIIPEIEKEVNEGKNFASLRQVQNSAILAAWYKKNLRQTLLGQVYVDQQKVNGISSRDQQAVGRVYRQYLEAFKEGVYNYIKEEFDADKQEVVPRKYFSGGFHETAEEIVIPVSWHDAGPSLSRMGPVRSVQVSLGPGSRQIDGASKKPNFFGKTMVSLLIAGVLGGFAAPSADAFGFGYRDKIHSKKQSSVTVMPYDALIRNTVSSLTSYGTRAFGTADNVLAAQFLRSNLERQYTLINGPVTKPLVNTVFYRDVAGQPAYVAACIPGKARNAGNLIFSAHFDAIGDGVGALDNTTGVSVLLALARQFSVGYESDANIWFVFTNDEEDSKLGVRVFVHDINAAADANPQHSLNFNVDSIGSRQSSGSSNKVWLVTPSFDSQVRVNSFPQGETFLKTLKHTSPFSIGLKTIDNTKLQLRVLSDADEFGTYGFPSITLSGLDPTDMSKTKVLHSADDVPSIVDPDVVGSIITWMANGLQQQGKALPMQGGDRIAKGLQPAVKPAEVNCLGKTRQLFKEFGLEIHSNSKISEEGFKVFQDWLTLLRTNFPRYRDYIRVIVYNPERHGETLAHTCGNVVTHFDLEQFTDDTKSLMLLLENQGLVSRYSDKIFFVAEGVFLQKEQEIDLGDKFNMQKGKIVSFLKGLRGGGIQMECSITGRMINSPYSFLHGYGALYVPAEVVLTHELGHFIFNAFLKAQTKENEIITGSDGETWIGFSLSEIMATEFSFWFLYDQQQPRSMVLLKQLPFIDSWTDPKYVHVTQVAKLKDIGTLSGIRKAFLEYVKTIGNKSPMKFPIPFEIGLTTSNMPPLALPEEDVFKVIQPKKEQPTSKDPKKSNDPSQVKTVPAPGSFKRGGIDLNFDNKNLQEQGDMLGFLASGNGLGGQYFQTDGVIPVIVNITTPVSFLALLGLKKEAF